MAAKNAQQRSQQILTQVHDHLKRTYGPRSIVSKKAVRRTVRELLEKKKVPRAPTQAPPPGEDGAEKAAAAPALPKKEGTLPEVRAHLGECTRCKLSKTRTNIVFGEGSPLAPLMFVGEGPGEQEDLQGRPFVGRAGQLLDKIIEAMGFKRGDVYIANVVKCRPPGNRRPEPDEVATCEPFLFRQIEIIGPRVIVALGSTALQCLLKSDAKSAPGITKMRGKFIDYRGTKLMPTYHPAFLLRNPPAKKDVWEDMKIVMKELGAQNG